MLLKLENLLLEVSKSDRIDLGDMREAEELILQSLLKGLSIERAGIWMRDEYLDGIRCTLLIDLHQQARYEDLLLTRSQYPKYFSALDEERCISAEDALSHPATAEFADGYLVPLGIVSLLDMPIRHRGKMVGIVCCEHIGQPKRWSEDEMSFAAAMADLVGRAISAKERNDYARQLELTNQSLESLVKQRTASLEKTLVSLKQAQQQLVENEKMASLVPILKTKHIAFELLNPVSIRMCSYPGALAQVLTNLVNNASQHAFDANTDNVIQIQLLPRGEKEVELCFSDNGKGMPEEVVKKIFEPFFTTKRGQGGSGLGLSICYNLITAKLKGQMTVESTLGKGTLFRLTLPLRVE